MTTYEEYCAICGIAIYSQEKGTSFMDVRVVDYEEHCEMVVTFAVCRECWRKIKTTLDSGLEKAIERRNELNKFDLIALDRRYNHDEEE
jgi:hypothetical protein